MSERAILPETLEVVDSHTEGEPTRVVIGGWPQLEAATMAARREELGRASARSGAGRSSSRAATTRSSARC